jgi:capsular exopolysaccharide synthesis family protein
MQLRDTLRHYCWVIRKYFPLIGFGALFCTCMTAGISLCLPPVYEASALIMVSGSTNVDSNTNNDIYSDQALAFSYSFLVTKDDVLQAAARQLPGLSVSLLRQDVSDSPITNTPMIEIRAQASSPQQAALIANVVAKSFIRIQLGKVSADLQNQDSDLSQHLQAARAASDAAQTKLMTLQAMHAPTGEITSQRDLSATYQANYTALLDNYHHLQSLELQVPATLNIFQQATPPDVPVSPHIWLNAGIAAALSLLLLVVAALLLDWMDETIKTEEDVMRLTALKPLGSVPSCISAGAAPAEKSVTLEKSIARSEAIDESFIPINTALLDQFESKRAIMVTGLRPACGTSTVAANLAMALTRSGRRVLLIDANLRRPVLHISGFQYFHSQSLVSCLAELRMSPLARQQIVTWLNQWRTRTPYLWFLPAGPVPLRPASLLSIPELRVLIQDLLDCQTIDLLIVDSAALDEGTDALALAAATDAAILVIEAGKEKKESLDRAGISLERFNAPILGVIINRWHEGLRSYFYTEHTYTERLQTSAHVQVPPSAASQLLPDTPHLPALTQEHPSDKLLACVIPTETPAPLMRVLSSTSPLAVAEPSAKDVGYSLRQTRTQHAIPTKHKGIIIPAKPYDLKNSGQRHGLRSYQGSRQQR